MLPHDREILRPLGNFATAEVQDPVGRSEIKLQWLDCGCIFGRHYYLGTHMKRYALLIILVGMAGCAAQKQAKFQELEAECRTKIPAVVGKYVALQQCIIAASHVAGFSGSSQELLNATRLQLAEQVDQGRMTDTQAKVEFARVRYQITSADEERNARQAAAAAAILGSMPRSSPAVVQPYVMPTSQPWYATCTRSGNTTNCTGN